MVQPHMVEPYMVAVTLLFHVDVCWQRVCWCLSQARGALVGVAFVPGCTALTAKVNLQVQ